MKGGRVAARNFSAWVPIDQDSVPEQRVVMSSAVTEFATPRPMNTNVVEVPRFLGADVGGGSALTEDTHDGDDVPMYSYQFNGKATIDQAESEDTVADEAESYSYEWLNSFHISYDNASIGVSAQRSSTAGDFIPYNSMYYRLRNNDTGAGYTADANFSAIVASAWGYNALSQSLGKAERGQFWTPEQGCVIAHPALRQALREIKDLNDRPILVELQEDAGVPGWVGPTLLGYPLRWSHGARVSSTFKMTVVRNYLIAFVNRRFMRWGNRISPQTRFIDASLNRDALEHTVQTRARRGFVLTVPQAASMVEVPTAVVV